MSLTFLLLFLSWMRESGEAHSFFYGEKITAGPILQAGFLWRKSEMLKEQIEQIIEEAARSLGYGVYESSMLLKGENSRIVVKIDHERGISHNDCENYSKRLTFLLDQSRVLPNYFLEISSPGLKRRIRDRGDFARFTGSPAKIIWTDGQKKTVLKGKIINVFDENIIFETDRGEETIPLKAIEQANLDY